MKIEKLLSRFDETDYKKLLGNEVIKILTYINNSEIYTKDLRKISLDLFGEKYFLENEEARSIVFKVLRTSEAKEIANIMNVKFKNDVEMYKKINSKKVNKNSIIMRNLYSFFEMEMPDLIESDENSIYQNIVVSPKYALFSHQRNAIKKLNSLLDTDTPRVLLHMPTGAGKTRTAMNVACDYLRNNEGHMVIWFASTEELCQQAFNEIEKAWNLLGNRNVNVYKLWGDSDITQITSNEGIIIAGFPKMNSLINSKSFGVQKFIEFATKLDFIIVDEAHQAIAPTYSFIINTIFGIISGKEKKLIGLSATPGRTYSDIEEDKKLSSFFAKNKVTLEVEGYENPVDYLVAEGYLASVKYKNIHYQNGVDYLQTRTQDDIPNNVLKLLGRDEIRNLQIIMHVEELAKRHSRIIVFAPSIESSDVVSIILRQKGYDAFSLTSNTEGEKRRKIIENYKKSDEKIKILVNYGILTTGFDAPETSAALIARPTLSLVLYSQMVGRAIRGVKAGGNEEAEIFTVIDSALPGFDNVASAFMNWEDVWN